MTQEDANCCSTPQKKTASQRIMERRTDIDSIVALIGSGGSMVIKP